MERRNFALCAFDFGWLQLLDANKPNTRIEAGGASKKMRLRLHVPAAPREDEPSRLCPRPAGGTLRPPGGMP